MATYGQLGLGDTSSRGNDLGEMGDNLPFVQLPDDFIIDTLSAGFYHICALSISRTAICWGQNKYGQLGNGQSGQTGDAYNIGLFLLLRVYQDLNKTKKKYVFRG